MNQMVPRLAALPILAVVLALGACEEQVTEPLAPFDDAATPFFNTVMVTQGLYASTNRGELVEINLAAGTATLIGDAGLFEGRELGWTDIAFDAAGNVFATSREASELSTDGCLYGEFGTGGTYACTHLYVLDAGTGAVLTEIGSTLVNFVSDIDFAADGTLFGSEWFDTGDGGALVTLDPTTAGVTLIGKYGPKPYPSSANIHNGGISVHLQTGELWGVESSYRLPATIFRIDPATGLPSDVTQLGLAGGPSPFGVAALEILHDGTFVGLRARGSSELYSINPLPDPVSGLAELTLIPLTLDPAIEGSLNGLESIGPVVPSDLIGDINGLISSGGLDANKAKSLISKVNLAQKFLDEGKVANAISMLEAFINQVSGYVNGGNITAEAGQALIDAAQAVIDGLSG